MIRANAVFCLSSSNGESTVVLFKIHIWPALELLKMFLKKCWTHVIYFNGDDEDDQVLKQCYIRTK